MWFSSLQPSTTDRHHVPSLLASLLRGRRQRKSQKRLSKSSVVGFVEILEVRTVPTYVFTLTGNTASLVGDATADTLTIDQASGLLRHNRFTAGDAGFVSDIDWDSTQAGEQQLAADASSILNLNTAGGADIVEYGTATVAASTVHATLNFNAGGNSGDTLYVDDGANSIGTTYTVQSVSVSSSAFIVNAVSTTITGGKTLRTSSGIDSVNVITTAANEPVDITTSGGADTITIGNINGVQNIQAAVTISNPNSRSILNVDNSLDTTGRNYTVTQTQISGLAPATINYAPNDISNLNVTNGSGSDTIGVSPSAFNSLAIAINGAAPATLPGDLLSVDLTGVTGAALSLTGPGAGQFNFTNSSSFTYSNIERLETSSAVTVGNINTGAGSDAINVSYDSGNVVVTVNGTHYLGMRLADIFGALTIDGQGGSDALTVDSTAGVPIPAGGLVFTAGEGGNDSMILTGGSFTTITHSFTNSNDGTVDFVGGTNPSLAGPDITYTGLDPITDNNAAVNRVFDFGAGNDDDVALLDDGVAGNNINRIQAPNNAELVDFTSPTGSLTVNLGVGLDVISVDAFDSAFPANVTINLNGGFDSDEIRLGAAPNGSTVNIDTESGTPDRVVIGRTAGGTAVSFAQFNQVANGTTLGAILAANVNVNDSGTIGEVYIDNSGDGTGRTFTVSALGAVPTFGGPGLQVNPSHLPGFINVTDDMAVFQLAMGTGNDIVNVDATTNNGNGGTAATFFGNSGTDTFNIDASNLNAVSNTFNGDANDDTFNVNMTTANAIRAAILIQGGANDFGGGIGSRDVVNVSDQAQLGPVIANLTYTGNVGGSEVTLAGGLLNNTLTVNTAETFRYIGSLANNDQITVVGTATDDLITAAPIDANRALVFNNSTADASGPFDGPPQNFNTRLPGVSGGSTRPDLDLSGLANANGLQIQDNGATTGDRLYVYGESDNGLSDGNAANPFGFGAGLLLPAVGAGNAFDNIVVTQNSAAVNGYVVVNYDTTDFVQAVPDTQPAVVINSGVEANPTLTAGIDVADSISVTLSTAYRFQVNGGNPDPVATGIVPPDGDRLVVVSNIALNVFSDQLVVPNVTVQPDPLAGLLPIGLTSIENAVFTAPTVNLIGDNNGQGGVTVQHDEFIVTGLDDNSPVLGGVGDGIQNDFYAEINGSAPMALFFANVSNLNIYGGQIGEADLGAGGAATGHDRASIQPFANNLQPWMVDVHVNLQDGDDRVAFTGVQGILDNVLVDANFANLGQGRIFDSNVMGTTSGVAVNFTNTENVNVNASFNGTTPNPAPIASNDGDTLTIQTTTIADVIVVRFDQDRTGTKPGDINTAPNDQGQDDIRIANHFDIVIDDGRGVSQRGANAGQPIDGTNASSVNPTVSNGFGAVVLDTRDGDDTITFNLVSNDAAGISDAQGGGAGVLPTVAGQPFNVQINAGSPNASDLVIVQGNAGLPDNYTVTPGADNRSGTVAVSGTDVAQYSFTGVENIQIDGLGGAGADTLTMAGTGADNSITVVGTGANSFTVQVDDNPLVTFAGMGTGASAITLNGGSGSDTFSVTPTGLSNSIDININGGDPTGSDTLIITGAPGVNDRFRLAPTGAGSGTVTSDGPDELFTGIEHLRVVLQPAVNDYFTVDGTVGNDDYRVTSGPAEGQYHIEGLMNQGGVGAFLLPTIDVTGNSTAFVGNYNFNGAGGTDRLIFTATDSNDRIQISSGGISHSVNGDGVNFLAFNNMASVVVEGGNGDDTFDVSGNLGYTLQVNGGNPDSGSDVLNFTSGLAGLITVNYSTSTLSQAGGSTINFSGIEHLNIDASNAAGVVVQGLAAVDQFTVTPTGNASAVITDAGVNTTINVNNVTSLTVNGNDGVVPTNVLTVEGSQAADIIAVDANSVDITGMLSVQFVDIQSVVVRGLAGSDTFNVNPAGAPPISIIGGSPSATLPGDVLNVTSAVAVTVAAGPDSDSGSVTAGTDVVTFDEIESLGVTLTGAGAAGAVVINGTNGDDDITVIGTGPNDFTVSINGGPAVQFTDATSLTINGQSGDDDVDLDLGVFTLPVTVNGGLPGAGSDTLTLHATAGNDTIGYSPSATLGAGAVTINAVPAVNFTTIEKVVIDGRGGTDTITHTTPVGVDQVTYTPGSASDAGTINTRRAGSGAALVPLTFQQIGAGGAVSFASSGGREDVLELNGTNDSEIFTVSGNSDRIQITKANTSFVTVALNTAGIDTVDLRGLDGDDTFNLIATLPYVGGVSVDGGNPSASDTLNLIGATGAIVENLQTQTVTGYGAQVSFQGVEHVNLSGTGGATSLTVSGTSGNDELTYTPTGAAAGTVTRAGQNVETNFTGISGTFTLSAAAGIDVITVNGTTASDAINVDRTAATVQVNVLKTVTFSSEAIVVAGGLGDDVINVTGNGAAGLTVDGGQPSASDTLNVTVSSATVTYGTDPATGTVNDISFLGIEEIGLTGDAAGSLTINGTNGNDAFNQSGNLVTVNNGATVAFAAYPTLTLNGTDGDDTFNLRSATLAGVTTFNVNGGDPTASDTVIINGTAAANTVTLTPLTADSATVTGLGPAINVATTEHLTYNGQGGADTMNLVTPAGNTIVYFTPGVDANEAGINLRQANGGDLLGFNYVNVDGFNSVLNLTSAGDSVNINGTADNDQFTVTPAGGVRIGTPVALGTPFKSVTINTAGAARLDLLGGSGNDTFNVPGNHTYATGLFVQGGDPSSGDILNVDGDNVAAALTVSLTASSVTQAGSVAVSYNGVETLNITGGANAITVNGVAGQDQIDATPTGVNTARLEVAGSNTVINTTNTAALTLNPGTGVDVITVHGSGDDDVIAVNRGATTTVQVSTQNPAVIALKTISINSGFTQTLVIAAGLGDDTINVTGAGGPGTLVVDGAGPSASDALNIDTGTDASVTLGADPTSGVVTATSGNVSFTGIEALGLSGDGTGTLTVNGTTGNDAIDQTGNRITVNQGTSVTFDSYPTLAISGNNGDDVINVNPATLAGVTTFNVDGGNPTASDKVIVNGTAGTDAVTINGIGSDSATVTGLGVDVNVTTTEHLVYSGLGGGDALTVTSSAGGSEINFTPGATADSGSITHLDFITGTSLLPIAYSTLGTAGSLTFDSNGGGQTSGLDVYGTSADDQFDVTAAGTVQISKPAFALPVSVVINTPGIVFMRLLGGSGDDIFNVPGDHSIPLGIDVQGGDPSASDVLNFTGAGAAVNLDLAFGSITEAGFAPVTYTGVEVANVETFGGDLNVSGTAGDDVLSVIPTGADAATLRLLSSTPGIGSTPVVNATGIGTLNVDLLTGADRLVVTASQAGETITADATDVTVGAFQTVSYINTEDLHLVGLAGSDTFNVTPALGTSIFVDGGDPIGSTPGDQLNLLPPAAFVLEPGPENDEGGIRGLLMDRVSWDHIEGITISGPGPAKVVGTNGDDDITIVARDASTHVGADGVQDFTVSINGGVAVLFLNQATLLVDALAGDDDIVVRAPAPNNAVWNVQLTVAGGTPAAATGDQGDVLEYETPGQQTITYTPGAIPGTGVINDITLASSITIAQFVCPVDGLLSSAGSIEQVILDGEGGNDSVTVIGTGAADSFLLTPGSAVDAGSIGVNNQLGLTFEDLGAGATLAIDGQGGSDTVTVDGTSNTDVFGVLASGNVTIAGHLTLTRTNFENLILRGANGDDVFNINGGSTLTNILVEGGDPSASDVLNYTATANAATAVDLGAATITQTGPAGAVVTLNGIERVNLTASGGASTLTVTGTAGDDTIDVTPTAAGTGSFVRLGLGGAPQFTYTGVGGAFTVNGGSGGFDTLGILGDDAADTVTSTASTVTIKGGTVTLGTSLEYLNISTFGGDDNVTLTGLAIAKTIDAGAGNDFVDLSAAVDATIFGGLGDDILIGSPVADLIYGGSGNDILIGGGGVDYEYGEDGNDQFGDLSLAGNGVANDTGADFLFGGEGADTFIWELGDGADTISGGNDHGDSLRFFGNGIANGFLLSANATNPSHFNLTLSGTTVDTAGVEDITVGTLGGPDSVTVADLTTTEVKTVTIDLGVGDADQVVVNGRNIADNIAVSSAAAGSVSIQGLGYDINIVAATTADTLTVNGNDGDDTIKANVGVETTIGIIFNGNNGNDFLSADATLNGGNGNDTLEGGAGADTINGNAGDDIIIFNAGTGIDTIDGGTGFDVFLINTNGNNNVISVSETAVTVDGGTENLAISNLEQFQVNSGDGNDTITVSLATVAGVIDAGDDNDTVNGSGSAAILTIQGGDGNDTLIGGSADDLIYGGSGNDILIGGAGIDHEYGGDGNDRFGDLLLVGNGVADDTGADFLFGGEGADTFVWELGDGSDTVEGGNDQGDSLRFIGSAAANNFVLSANAADPSHFNLNLGAATVDTAGVEQVILSALAGADTVTVGDLSTTEIHAVNIDLGAGDADAVTVNGRNTPDNLAVSSAVAGSVGFQGLGYDVNITSATTVDTLTVNGNEGNDIIKVNAGVETTIGIVLNGNDGDDFLSADAVINGGNGNDTIEGGAGADILNGDAGDDIFIFNAGTGVDTINGGTGGDTFLIETNILNNVISVSETAVTVDGATENLAISNVELFHVRSSGGNDTITLSLATVAGLVEAGSGNDSVNGSATTSTLTIFGEDGNDSLIGSAGADLIYGGAGNDLIIGGAGIDHEYGEAGNDQFGDLALAGNGVADDADNDLIFGGDGADIFIWEPGDGSDAIQGGDDEGDVLRFLGSPAANAFLLSANGIDPTHFNLTLAAATVDTTGVEQVILSARAGADSVTVNDLATTEIKAVNIDLGVGDADAVTYNGRNVADDVAISSPVAGTVTFQGLGYDLNILNATTADTLTVNGNEGDDTIKANVGVENTIAIVLNGNDGNDYLSADATLNGGNGNDTLIGGLGVDTLNGDAGDDFLTGNGSADFINGGTGIDTIVEYRDANFTLTNTALTIGAEGTDTLTSIERADLTGGLGANNFDIGAFSGTTTIFGDEGSDTLDFHAQTSVLKIDLDLVDEAQVVSPTGRKLILEDAIENVIATAFNDLIYVDIALFDRFIDGGNETTIPPGDRLHVDMLQSNPVTTKVPNGKLGSYDGTVNGSFYTGTINYEDIETLVIDNPNGGGGNNNGDIPIDFGAATDYPIANGPHGVQAADVNGDGILDMIVAAKLSGTVSVRFGNGFGGFGTEAVYNSGAVKKERSITVALSDVDNDGDLDIVVTNRKDNSVGVLLNNGAGVFSGPTNFATGVGKLGKFPMSVKMGDMNNDGDVDIVTTNASKGKKHSSIAILLGNGDGTFGTATTTPVEGRKARDLVLGDFNQDGNLDIVATNLFSREIVYFAGNGTGGIAAPVSFPVGAQPTSIIAADFNGDGLLDVAVTCQVTKEISVLYGTGAPGIFSETIGIKYPNVKMEISINSADLNGDGNADLIVANRVTNTLSYMLGLGNGTFDTRVDFKVGGIHGRQPVAIAYGDFNNDGAIDLLVANAGTDDVSVLLRNPLV